MHVAAMRRKVPCIVVISRVAQLSRYLFIAWGGGSSVSERHLLSSYLSHWPEIWGEDLF